MNKIKRAAVEQERLAKYAKIRNSILFAMGFINSYVEVALKEPKDKTEELYKDQLTEAVVDLDDARQLYDYLLGENKHYD